MSEAGADDTAARLAATDPAHSVLLEAPAGSGKTAVLTQRFLRLLCTVDEPGQILAITFTKKAAAEMLGRVSRALRGEFDADDPTAPQQRVLAQAALAHGAARGWRLQEGAQALRIQTIDAFNFWLASELPVASRSGTELTVLEAPEPLYLRAARQALLAAEGEPELAADGALLFDRLDNHWENLERLIAGMLAERGHWLRFVVDEDPQALCARVNASLADLARAAIAQVRALLPEPLRRRAEALPGVGALSADAAAAPAWHALGRLCFTAGGDWRQRITTALGAAFADRARARELSDLIADLSATPGLREALGGLRRLPPVELPPEDAAAVAALARVLRRAAIELQAEFAAAGRVDYTYLTGAARQALTEAGEPTELALRTGLNLRHILVDEFQDTSLAQVQLLTDLTAGWEPGDGRTLFVVGDPMQSIYRFRDAEVGLFLKARDVGIGALRLMPLKLRRNFRSVPALVAFTNALFGTIFPARDDLRSGAVAYTDSLAALPERAPPEGIPLVTSLLFEERAAEARALAGRIGVLRELEPDASIGVLVTAHSHAVLLTEAIERGGLPVVGVDLVPLAERAVVRDLVALGQALTDLADRTAWLTVLRAPWCGVSLVTLTALSGLNERQLLFQALGDPKRLRAIGPADRARLARVQAVAAEALAALGTQPLADLLEASWLALGAADAYTAPELADARAFLAALAERTASFDWRGSADFATLAAGLFSAPQAGGRNPVQVMTVHRAKGLQFDHVFLPALERGHRGGERRLLAWADLPSERAESELIIAPAPAVGTPEGTLQRYLRDLFRDRDVHERQRLLYVAVTRARRTLWLSGTLPRSEDEASRPRAQTPLHTLWPALEARFDYAAVTPAVAAARAARPLVRLRDDWQPPVAAAGVALAHLPGAHLAAGAPVEFSWVGETQRHIGTVVHAHLAQLAQQPQLPGREFPQRAQEEIRRELARLGISARELPAAVGRVTEALANTLADPRGRWLLDAKHPQAASELALTGVAAGTLRNVVIDRAFVDESGTRWVVDFKTSRHEGGGVEAFLDAELERYRGQLELYAALARGLGPEPVRAALYFPLLKALRELG
ncbi:MAG: UvrD-helicase domain-containing protein [Proteobacteria bacterium]|nr:UvrD-helicase domain-containing protein [Pseudomonadota bacterium]